MRVTSIGKRLGGDLDLGDQPVDCSGGVLDLFSDPGPVVILDGFTNTRQGLDPVAGVKSGRINLMPKPWPTRQAAIVNEGALGLVDVSVELGELR